MFKFLDKRIIYFIKNKQGIAIPVFAVIAATAVTVVVTAAEVNQYVSHKHNLQMLADQAVKSSIALDNSEININKNRENTCENIFKEGVKEFKDISLGSVKCQFLEEQKRVNLIADVTIATKFASKIGISSLEKEIKATASMNALPNEVVVAVSTSGGMCANNLMEESKKAGKYLVVNPDMDFNPDSEPPIPCKKIGLAHTAIDNLMTQLKGMDNVKVGLVPYTYKVRFPDLGKIPPSLKKSKLIIKGQVQENSPEDEDFYTDFSSEPALKEIIPLKNLYNNSGDELIQLFKNNITADIEAPIWSRTDLALHVAGLMLDPKSTSYFQGTDSKYTVGDFTDPENPDDATVQKNIILLSDGANLGGAYTNNPTGNFENQYLYNYKPYHDHTLAVCRELQKRKVRIFTVLLNVPKETAGADIIEDLMARCASEGEEDAVSLASLEAIKGKYLTCASDSNCYKADATEDLPNIFTSIGRRMKEIQLRQ